MPNISYPTNMSVREYQTLATPTSLEDRVRQLRAAQAAMGGRLTPEQEAAAAAAQPSVISQQSIPASRSSGNPPYANTGYIPNPSLRDGPALGVQTQEELDAARKQMIGVPEETISPYEIPWWIKKPYDSVKKMFTDPEYWKEFEDGTPPDNASPASPGKVPPNPWPDLKREDIGPPPDITPKPEEVAAPQSMADSVAAYKQQLAGMYPAFDYNAQTPSEQALIDYEEKDRQRTKLLAQLALSAGIASAGGGSWESVGKGLAAAGGVYDEGFQRYQKALEGRAQREMSRRESQYKDDFKRTELAVGMYQDQQELQRKIAKDKADRMDKIFELTKVGELKPNPITGEIDPEERKRQQEYERDVRRWYFDGIRPEVDVTDK